MQIGPKYTSSIDWKIDSIKFAPLKRIEGLRITILELGFSLSLNGKKAYSIGGL